MECGRQRLKVKTILLQCFALHKFQVTDGQNMRDQMTSDRWSKHVWSNCVLCIPFILSGNECWLHTWDACAITTWRLGLRAPLATCNNENIRSSSESTIDNFQIPYVNCWSCDQYSLCCCWILFIPSNLTWPFKQRRCLKHKKVSCSWEVYFIDILYFLLFRMSINRTSFHRYVLLEM